MATEAQIAANRRNARLSTGPRTKRGKARSRRNGYGPEGRKKPAPKLPAANPRALEDRVAEFLQAASLAATEEEKMLLKRAAELSCKIEQANRAESAYLARAVRKAEERRQATEADAASRAADLTQRLLACKEAGDDDDIVEDRSRKLLEELEESSLGRTGLLHAWAWMRARIEAGTPFGISERFRLARLLGYEPFDLTMIPDAIGIFLALNAIDEEGPAVCAAFFAMAREQAAGSSAMIRNSLVWREEELEPGSEEVARAFLLERVDEEVNRLTLLQAETEADRADREALAASTAVERLRREASAMHREFLRVLEEIRRVRRAGADAGPEEGESAPAKRDRPKTQLVDLTVFGLMQRWPGR